jgi:hypothetical protein
VLLLLWVQQVAAAAAVTWMSVTVRALLLHVHSDNSHSWYRMTIGRPQVAAEQETANRIDTGAEVAAGIGIGVLTQAGMTN